MGCPDIYYKGALQAFARSLNYFDNNSKAKELYEENNIEILENEIIRLKDKILENEFYFEAGRAFESVLNNSSKNDGCDGLNACIGGLNLFTVFIGVDEE